MNGRDRTRRSSRGTGWAPTLAGAVFLVGAGFLLGVVVGATGENPRLLLGHARGQSERVPLASLSAPQAQPPEAAAPEPPPAPPTAPAAPATPPPLAPPAAVAAPPPAAGGFAIQVGAFGEPRAAQGLAARLRAKGFPVHVVESSAGAGRRWRVRVGPVASRPEADALAARLKQEERLPTWVVAHGS